MAAKAPKKEKVYELVFGIHPILELLQAKRRSLVSLYTTKPTPKGWHILAPKLPLKLPINYVARDVLTRMADNGDHQGFVAWATPFIWRKQPFDPARHTSLLLLDRIQDPRNLGAILRSAYCTNVNGVIVCKKGGAPLSPTAIIALKKAGYTIYLATLDGINATTITFKEPFCLVIGNEGTGIASDLLSSGTRITLPQHHADISYNASVAAGILLFLAATQTKKI